MKINSDTQPRKTWQKYHNMWVRDFLTSDYSDLKSEKTPTVKGENRISGNDTF